MDIVLYLLVNAGLAIIPATIARNKGYKPFWFWAFGFIVSFLIALIWVLLMKPGWQKKCPHCCEMIKPDAKVCRYCGRNISAGVESSDTYDSHRTMP